MVMRARLVANPPLLAAFLRFALGMPGLLPRITGRSASDEHIPGVGLNHIYRRILISPIFWRGEGIRWVGVLRIFWRFSVDQSEARSRDQVPVPITFWQLSHDQTGPIRGRCQSHVITWPGPCVPCSHHFLTIVTLSPTYLKSCVIKQFRPAA